VIPTGLQRALSYLRSLALMGHNTVIYLNGLSAVHSVEPDTLWAAKWIPESLNTINLQNKYYYESRT
jgi:hypothetical protein